MKFLLRDWLFRENNERCLLQVVSERDAAKLFEDVSSNSYYVTADRL